MITISTTHKSTYPARYTSTASGVEACSASQPVLLHPGNSSAILVHTMAALRRSHKCIKCPLCTHTCMHTDIRDLESLHAYPPVLSTTMRRTAAQLISMLTCSHTCSIMPSPSRCIRTHVQRQHEV